MSKITKDERKTLQLLVNTYMNKTDWPAPEAMESIIALNAKLDLGLEDIVLTCLWSLKERYGKDLFPKE